MYRAPPIDRSILPTAPRAAREPNVDRSRLPRSPPYTAFLGNLPYDVSEDSIKTFFRGLSVRSLSVVLDNIVYEFPHLVNVDSALVFGIFSTC